MDALIKRASQLHSAPAVARSVLNLTREEDFDVGQLVDCIEADPALTARLLATVNSARYSLAFKVTNLRQTITLLGQRSLRLIAMTFSIVDVFTRGAPKRFYDDFWLRALTTAWVAGRLCRDRDDADPSDAYTAGLLADLGILVLAQFERDRYLPLYMHYDHGTDLVAAERDEFGFDHAGLSAAILEQWEFPQSLASAVALHHDGQQFVDTTVGKATRAGNLMANVIWTADSSVVHSARNLLRRDFSMDVDQMIDLALVAKDAVEQEAEVYGIKSLETPDCESLLEEARRRYHEAAIESALELDSICSVLAGPTCDMGTLDTREDWVDS